MSIKSRHDRFFKNYRAEMVPAGNRRGYKKVLVYIGDLYTWELPDGSFPSVRRWMGFAELISLGIFFACALTRADINRAAYIAAPTMASLAVWIFELIAAAYFCLKKLPLQEDDYEYIDKALPVTLIMRFVLLSFAAAAGVVFLLAGGFSAPSLFVMLGYALGAALAFFMFRKYRGLIPYLKVTPSDAKPEEK